MPTPSTPRFDLTSTNRQPARRRRIAGGIAAALILALIAPAAWLGTRFDLFGRAQAAYDRRQYRDALQMAKDHLARFPNDPTASLMAARCLIRLGKFAEAEDFYRRTDRFEPDDMQARALGLLQENEPRRGRPIYEELLTRRPEDVLALKRLAAVRMGLKQWKAVVDLADRLIAMPAEEVAGKTLAAIAHHELKHYGQSVEAARRVIELDPGLNQMPLPRTLFWNNLAMDLMALGQTEEARGYLERALADSEDAGLMELLGLTYSQQGSRDEAERCWRRAERWDPNNADVCLDLGRLAMSRRRWDEALGFLRRAADRSPEAVEPLYNLGQVYGIMGRHDEAERYRRQADRRRQAQPPSRGGMGGDVDPDSMPERDGVPGPEPAR